MKLLATLYKNIFSSAYFALIIPVLFIISCEEQVDDLWDANDDTGSVSPVVGDWYADSIHGFDECNKDSVGDLMLLKNLNNYNLWLLTDGSFQLAVGHNVNIKDDCDYWEGTWDNSTGCSSSYYDYYNYSPLQYCNDYYELNQYNVSTTDCSQDINIEGTWVADETASTITLTTGAFCENSFGDPSYLADAESCGNLENGTWNAGMTRTYDYSIDASGAITLDGKWFDSAASCVKFYMSVD
ncbi:MAG: hypothetical protein CMG41_06615 [Candidatus Marinimicrobia bacterium]|nr:hypothetical protein [Candidatus Neomarinimicrobiota bacterium]|tara:strand:- start:172 stop:894 length:723 start_codon:yes stop_codon:yes gene_type:complete